MRDVKAYIKKFYTPVITAAVVLLFTLSKYIIFEMSTSFWTDAMFWINLGFVIILISVIRDTYWRNGSVRGSRNEKYIGSTFEYSFRIGRVKSRCLDEDFHNYINEKNIELFINARNELLDQYGVLKTDYYSGNLILVLDEEGNTSVTKSKPHCEMAKAELKALTKMVHGEEVPYYTRKQRKVITDAIRGHFRYEVLSGTEILSGIKVKHNKYGTNYNAATNKAIFMGSKIVTTLVFSVLFSLLGARISRAGWNLSALYDFVFACILVIWHAINADDAGYSDIVDTKRGVNINRASIAIMYATARNIPDLFDGIDLEIDKAWKDYLGSLPLPKPKKEKEADNGDTKGL